MDANDGSDSDGDEGMNFRFSDDFNRPPPPVSKVVKADAPSGPVSTKQLTVPTGKKRKASDLSSDTQEFASLKLNRLLLSAITEVGYSKPTPIQAEAIPLILEGKDVCGSAQTGSGKTAAFVLPILHMLSQRTTKRHGSTRVLALLPTRELTVQCADCFKSLGRHLPFSTCVIVGGLSTQTQVQELRTRPDIVVATPGRLIDHLINTQAFALEEVEFLVLDEADRLLELGFREEVEHIVRALSRSRQTLFFSATMSTSVGQLMKVCLNNPVRVSVDAVLNTADGLKQEFIRLAASDEHVNACNRERECILLSLCERSLASIGGTIIFCTTKEGAHRMKIILSLRGLAAVELHGNMTQAGRLTALADFREGRALFLVATDVAARGLDIAGTNCVVNMQLPRTEKEYVHRVGRTARASRQGLSISLVSHSPTDHKMLKSIVKHAAVPLGKRTIPPPVMEEYSGILRKLEGKITSFLEQEKQEKEVRMAEMEMQKVQNFIDHEAEIYSRPAKKWMESSGPKKHKQHSHAGGERASHESKRKESKPPGKGKGKRNR